MSPADALSSSTTYYKNGSSFYTLSSSESHYKCTNSEHSGSNDYTSSSVSGTCYSWKQCDECGGNWSNCSCRDYYTCGDCGGSGTKTTTKTVTCTKCNGSGFITLCHEPPRYCYGVIYCEYCNAAWPLDDAESKAFLAEACPARSPQPSPCPTTEEQTTTTKCSACGGSGEQSSYSSYTTRNVSHSLSLNYTQYTYKNIDTGSTTTSTSSYSTATGFTISYNSNGGSGSMSSQYFLHGHSQALTANAFTRTNYKFKGWATSSSGSVTYTDKQSVNISSGSNITLYANWELLSFTVTLDNQGATTAGTTSVTATNGQAMPSITVPTKTGYTFGGYYSGTNGGGTQYYTASGASAKACDLTGATTLYAKWTANTYSVKYNANGGSGTMSNSSHTYGSSKALTANAFTRTGYDFAGWATSASGAVVYSNGQSVSNLSSTQGATVTLYAKWTANTYTINYNANGGAGTTASSSHTYDASKNLTANGFTRSGYRFLGWSTSNTATSATYTDKASVKNLATSGSITLYAVWQKVYVIQVKSNINGAAGVLTGGGTYDANKSVTLTAYAMKGYEFLHWLKDGATFSGNDTNVVTISATSDSTYTAVFAEAGVKINNSAIRMVCGSGTVYGMVSSKNVVKNGTQYVAVSASPSSGYKFTGWKIGDTLSTTYTTADALIPLSEVRNKVITAVFASSTVTASSVAELGEIVVNTELFASSIIDSSSCSITVNANISGAVGVLSGGGSYALNGSATLKAYAKKGYQLAYWLKDGKVFANNNTNQITVTVTNDCTYTAVFIESGVKINGVAVDSICTDDASITACGDVAMSTIVKDDVTYVVVTVTPSAGYKFVGWAIDGVISTKYIEDTCAFAYSDVKDKLITARFEKIDKSNINDDVDNS